MDSCEWNLTEGEKEELLKKLLGCPFCGGDADMVSNTRDDIYYIQCRDADCFAQMGTKNSALDAVRVWNNRAN